MGRRRFGGSRYGNTASNGAGGTLRTTWRSGASLRPGSPGGLVASMRNEEPYEALARIVKDCGASKGRELLDDLVSLCWAECVRRMPSGRASMSRWHVDANKASAALENSQKEVIKLKEKLVECNKQALRQVAAFTSSLQHPPEESVEFYEPLQFVEPRIKEMVLEIVAYKMWQIERGMATSWMDELMKNKAAEAANAKSKRDHDEESDDPLLSAPPPHPRRAQKPGQLCPRCAGSSGRGTEEAPSAEVLRMQQRLQDAMARLEASNAECARLQALLEEVEESSSELRQRELESRQQMRAAAERAAAAEKEVAQLRKTVATNTVSASASDSHACSPAASATVAPRARSGNALAADDAAAPDLGSDGVEAADHRISAAVPTSKAVGARSVQTDLSGDDIDKLQEENKQLKVMLEELRAKLGEMIREGAKKGIGQAMDQLVDKVGLREVLDVRSIFERLYQDAKDRIVRLQKLRERFQQERKIAVSEGVSCYSIGESGSPSNVYEAVARSDILDQLSSQAPAACPRGMRRLLQRPAPVPLQGSPSSPVALAAPWRATPTPSEAPPRQRSTRAGPGKSFSLPALATVQSTGRPELLVNGLEPNQRWRVQGRPS
eukprot:TRINITY_DN21674_c0_g1_i1.p1 TRINITY_DN21674_c0_g1~~TRINITY_DN21674_c0_g1_i1.p1  ORF type:complete len:675 (-),score=104.74 TRINITY_DN21674_c0_g1_i1:14-1843(-)